jgi:hypothetical protein
VYRQEVMRDLYRSPRGHAPTTAPGDQKL